MLLLLLTPALLLFTQPSVPPIENTNVVVPTCELVCSSSGLTFTSVYLCVVGGAVWGLCVENCLGGAVCGESCRGRAVGGELWGESCGGELLVSRSQTAILFQLRLHKRRSGD